jgi:SAM-dependent methyltransferase
MIMSFSNYGELCTEVYELTKKVGQSLSGDIEFYQNKLKSCSGKVLEGMVGSGRVLIPLLEAGIKMDGADYSPEMLAACRKYCEEGGLSTNLYESNLQNLDLSQQYEAIIIPGGSFLLIENRNESIVALRKLYEHLQSGGKLILDLFLPESDFDVNKGGEVSTFHLPDGNLITMERKLVEANFLEQYKVYYLKYEKWCNGSLLQTELQRFAMRWFGVEEFKLLLADIGFEDIQVYADYDESKVPSDANQIFVYEATKK